MSLIFYDHLIDRQPLVILIDSLDLPAEKKSKFVSLADDILHTGIIEFILQKLHPHHHHAFLNQVQKAPYDPELLKFLQKHIDDQIETQIKAESQRILKLIHRDFGADINQS